MIAVVPLRQRVVLEERMEGDGKEAVTYHGKM